MERETQTISVGGNEFVTKTYATAREANTIQQAYFKGTKVEIANEQPKISEFNPNVQFEVQLELIRQMVLTMNGDDKDIASRCEALPNDVFEELATTLDAIVSKKKK